MNGFFDRNRHQLQFEARGMQLYTRKANYPAQLFYTNYGFKKMPFDFTDSPKSIFNQTGKLHLPSDDATDHPEAFTAFNIDKHGYTP